MSCILILASDDEISRLLAEPERVYAFVREGRTSLDLDKAWHGIHFLLAGSAWEGEGPLAFLLSGGGELIGEEGFGYGPPRALNSNLVARIDEALAGVSLEELGRRFNGEAMMQAEIYPQIWDRDPSEDDTREYLLSYFEQLKDFVSTARRQNSGLVLYLG